MVVGLLLTTLGDGGRLFTRVDGQCDKPATVAGRLLTAPATIVGPW